MDESEYIDSLQKTTMYLSMGLGDGIAYFQSLPLWELREIIQDYTEVLKERGK